MRLRELLVAAALVVLAAAAAACGSNGQTAEVGAPQPSPSIVQVAASPANSSGKMGGINPAEYFPTVLNSPAPALPSDLAQRQLNAGKDNGADWLMYGRTYSAMRYSPLKQITKKNVARLKPVWTLETGLHNGFESSNVVVDGTMYVTTPWNNVLALDAATGKVYWRFVHKFQGHPRLCCDAVNRGVGVGAGRVVMATLDAHVVALDARTGELQWDVKMADVDQGYSATLAPQVIGNKAIVGISGGEYGVRGFIDCYDITSGKRLWRFHTTPGPGEPGHDTWEGDSWKTGGAPNWMTCSYEASRDTIYCGIGNAAPDINGDKRAGINLYATCVVALDVNTGKLKWYYQTVPHDIWDLDCTVNPVIADVRVQGKPRQLVMFAPKNGYFYAIDRITGKPVYAVPVAHRITWGTVTRDGVAQPDMSKAPVREQGTKVSPGATGGKEWANEAYDPKRHLMFIPLTEMPFTHFKVDAPRYPGEFYWGGYSVQDPAYGHITAVDVRTGKVKWEVRTGFPQMCSITCTASGPGHHRHGRPDDDGARRRHRRHPLHLQGSVGLARQSGGVLGEGQAVHLLPQRDGRAA